MANRTVDKNKDPLAGAGSSPAPEDDLAGLDNVQSEEAPEAAPRQMSQQQLADLEEIPSYEAEDLRLPSGAVTARPAPREVSHGGLLEALLANRFTRFFAEAYIELTKKVTWPQPRDAWNLTLVVIGMSLAVAVVLGIADLVFNQALAWALAHASSIGPAAHPTPTPAPAAPTTP